MVKRAIDSIFQAQILILTALSHLIYGQPRPDAELHADLAETEQLEALIGKTTLRGDMLRFQAERRKLVSSLHQTR